MGDIICKRCQSQDYRLNGTVRGKQRYFCKDCKCNFTITPKRGKSHAIKALAVLLYGLGNMSFRRIARILGVSNVSVLRWIRTTASNLPEPEVPAEATIIMLDEMHHFLKKSQINYGFGERLILFEGELLPGFWVGVMIPAVKSFSAKSA